MPSTVDYDCLNSKPLSCLLLYDNEECKSMCFVEEEYVRGVDVFTVALNDSEIFFCYARRNLVLLLRR